ncbi:MAG TPA: lysylphosphatidylglycerol synthase transmembrane domain-containing protein [Gaiellaceae bacterium]|nr:lysylphosphatidylglycerol synthase transmembrane domain-containing protein [Gaiellaceae bacterium]
MSEATSAGAEVTVGGSGKSRGRRFLEIGIWVGALVVVLAVLQLLGVDVIGWIQNLWKQIKAVPPGYIVVGLIFQTGQTFFAGLSYYGILGAAYPGQVTLWPIITAYAVGVAMNNFLPANIGTFVTLLMFVALIPSATLGGSIAAYLVQKIFFTVAGTFVYLYLFLSVPNSFDLNLGNISAHPGFTVAIVVGGGFGIAILVRLFWRQVKKLWDQAKQGGVILTRPKEYFLRAFLPSFLSYLCKYAVIGIFLAAFAIPVTFESITWVVGSGSLANVASFTPGAVGITQATNAAALKVCCHVPNNTSVAYSTAQQLITTAWNIFVATILVVVVFGWVGGKKLVTTSYEGAKEQVAERKEEHREKREERKAERRHEREERKAERRRKREERKAEKKREREDDES